MTGGGSSSSAVEHVPPTAPSPLAEERVGQTGPSFLTEYFLTPYAAGDLPELHLGGDYELQRVGEWWVLWHRETDIRVWPFAVDVRTPEQVQAGQERVRYHYTDETTFEKITRSAEQNVGLWACKDLVQDANLGEGIYCTSLEPGTCQGQDALLINNHWPGQSEQDPLDIDKDLQHWLGTPLLDKLRQEFPGRTAYCIPIICDVSGFHQPPDAREPLYNVLGERQPAWRDISVVKASALERAQAVRKGVLIKASQQVNWSRANLDLSHPSMLRTELFFAFLLLEEGKFEQAEEEYEGIQQAIQRAESEDIWLIKNGQARAMLGQARVKFEKQRYVQAAAICVSIEEQRLLRAVDPLTSEVKELLALVRTKLR